MRARDAAATGDGRRSRGLRSLTNKVALLFAGVVLVAFGVVYFFIVPQLQSSLEQQVLDDLDFAARETAEDIQDLMGGDAGAEDVNMVVQSTADQTDARVTLLGIQRSVGGTGSYFTIADSAFGAQGVTSRESGEEFEDVPGASERSPTPTAEPLPEPEVTLSVADSAVDQEAFESGIGRARGQLVAQAAAPLRVSSDFPPEWVAVYSRPLEGATEAVDLIRRQVLIAGALAVLVALFGGWLVARAVAARLRRLEAAARDVAEGRSAKPVPVDSEDEIGELTQAFNEMREQLERTEQARREFIANASHELRTPIFSLGGFAELLEDEDLDEETRERFLHSMREQIDRLKKLAADLLDLSRLDAGALGFHWRECDLVEVVDTTVREFGAVAAAQDVELALELPTGGLEGYCDPDRVAQIVRILLDNALRHTPSGTPVRVALERADGAVALAVSDAGQGLEPAAAARVFERFYTADAARGSGLGLAIARELAERMGGRIQVASALGHTRFTLSLPDATDHGAQGDGRAELDAGVGAASV